MWHISNNWTSGIALGVRLNLASHIRYTLSLILSFSQNLSYTLCDSSSDQP
ncbi:hypothetical protein HanIR_Chr04g0167731 [Helianthus annuus]|nr:hypothetical protein HanIR_Chr04g0167731 [Helianthus annuus]